MDILSFLINLMSGATLLLFAVRFMRVAIERLWSGQIRRSLSVNAGTVSLLLKGTGLGFVLQGGTVVMLMAAGLAGSGTIPVLSAAIVALGADLGSALAVQVLTLPIGAVGPVAIFAGGWLYLNASSPERRNFGRVVLGLGLIFLSLTLIRAAVAPLQEFSGLSGALAYVNSDPMTAALLGLFLTLLMHSGLAAVLTAVAFASHGQLGAVAGLAFVIGCNIGSAFLPIWLLRSEPGPASSVARAVACLRVGLALTLLAVVYLLPRLPDLLAAYSADRLIILGHVGFNLLLLMLAPLLPLVLRLFPVAARDEDARRFVLPEGEEDLTVLTLALKGQVNKMLDLLVQMFDLATGSERDITAIGQLERRMNRALSDIRHAYAGLPDVGGKQIQQIMDFAIRIEACADLLNGKYATIRNETLRGEYGFSEDGKAEIAALIGQVRKGMVLAQNVFWKEDLEAARDLVEHKRRVSVLEAQSKQDHLARVRSGNAMSLGSSDGHLELVGALKSINSKLATIAYAVLEASGELRATRLR